MGRRSRTTGRVVGHLGNLGRSLVNQKEKKKRERRINPVHDEQHVADAIEATEAAPMDEKKNLKSVTDRSELDDFLEQAIMRDQQFVAEKQQVIVLGKSAIALEEERPEVYDYEVLQIPRRPKWDGEMSAESFSREEKDAFLKWRREIANISETASGKEITPFEKNLEVWKQLWRVVERSDIVVQIVDARDPLLYRCADIEKYVKEIDPKKQLLLLINKADYLSQYARTVWASYFDSHGVEFVFFSAAMGQAQLDEEAKQQRASAEERSVKEREIARAELASMREKRSEPAQHGHEDGSAEDESEAAPAPAPAPAATPKSGAPTTSTSTPAASEPQSFPTDRTRIFNRAELLDYFRAVWRKHRGEAEMKDSSTTATATASAADKKEDTATEDDDTVSESAASVATTAATSASASSKPLKGRARKMQKAIAQVMQKKQQNASASAKAQREQEEREKNRKRVFVGMVGYPNVGKSSTINVLVGAKKTSVSATPGRTKHFQTLNVGEDITLVDCPGLVFPTFGASRAHLVCSGILPIAQLHDHLGPTKVLLDRIGREQFLRAYAITFHSYKTITTEELLMTHAKARGFVKDHGVLDQSKSARVLLKDLCRGKLLYCHPPPGLNEPQRQAFRTSILKPLENSREGHVIVPRADEDDAEAAIAFEKSKRELFESKQSEPPASSSSSSASSSASVAAAAPTAVKTGDEKELPDADADEEEAAEEEEDTANGDDHDGDDDMLAVATASVSLSGSSSAVKGPAQQSKIVKPKFHPPIADDDQSVPLLRDLIPGKAGPTSTLLDNNGQPLSKKKMYRARIAMKKDSKARMRGPNNAFAGGSLESIQANTTGKFGVVNYRRG